MVIGWPEHEPKDGAQASASAWAQVEAAQRDVRLPCLLVPQPSHAVLAGELAAALLPAPFGPLQINTTTSPCATSPRLIASIAPASVTKTRAGPA